MTSRPDEVVKGFPACEERYDWSSPLSAQSAVVTPGTTPLARSDARSRIDSTSDAGSGKSGGEAWTKTDGEDLLVIVDWCAIDEIDAQKSRLFVQVEVLLGITPNRQPSNRDIFHAMNVNKYNNNDKNGYTSIKWLLCSSLCKVDKGAQSAEETTAASSAIMF